MRVVRYYWEGAAHTAECMDPDLANRMVHMLDEFSDQRGYRLIFTKRQMEQAARKIVGFLELNRSAYSVARYFDVYCGRSTPPAPIW